MTAPAPIDLWSADIPLRFHTLTLGQELGGSDIALQDLTTGQFYDMIDSATERMQAALYAYRGQRVPDGVEREKLVRSFSAKLGRLLVKTVSTFLTSASDAVELPVEDRNGTIWRRWVLGGEHLVEMRELTFGEIEDAKHAEMKGVSRQRATAAAAARACGRDIADKLLALPAYRGIKVLALYSEMHNSTEEEERDFFATRVVEARPPTLI
jgi:hypothetical protein